MAEAVPNAESRARRAFNRWISTFFLGADLRTWRRVLRDNRHAVDAQFLPRAALISAASVYTSIVGAREERRYAAALDAVTVPPPLVVLGHWRSGLSLLQQLLALDDRLAAPNLHQVRHPRTFLSTEAAHTRFTSWMLPARHPGDGRPVDHGMPEDDEYALANLTACSPYVGGLFPRRRRHYVDTYLTLRGAPPEDVAGWKRALATFARKLTWRHRRPLVLRSPLHLGRIRLLLEVFPEARFLHLARHPYDVFAVTCDTTAAAQPYNRLQDAPPLDVPGFVLDRYTRLYDAFFEDRGLLAPGRLCEIRFEDLARDPVATLGGAYQALGLPSFDDVRRLVEQGAARSAEVGTGAATHRPLAPPLQERVARAWRRSFDAWGYAA